MILQDLSAWCFHSLVSKQATFQLSQRSTANGFCQTLIEENGNATLSIHTKPHNTGRKISREVLIFMTFQSQEH